MLAVDMLACGSCSSNMFWDTSVVRAWNISISISGFKFKITPILGRSSSWMHLGRFFIFSSEFIYWISNLPSILNVEVWIFLAWSILWGWIFCWKSVRVFQSCSERQPTAPTMGPTTYLAVLEFRCCGKVQASWLEMVSNLMQWFSSVFPSFLLILKDPCVGELFPSTFAVAVEVMVRLLIISYWRCWDGLDSGELGW